MLHQLPDLSRLLESAPAKVEPQNCNLITPVRLGDAVSNYLPVVFGVSPRTSVPFQTLLLGRQQASIQSTTIPMASHLGHHPPLKLGAPNPIR